MTRRAGPWYHRPMPDLTTFVDQGIIYEDQFIETYLKVLRDEGFMELFGKNQDEARTLLTTMMEESARHKAELEQLKAKLT